MTRKKSKNVAHEWGGTKAVREQSPKVFRSIEQEEDLAAGKMSECRIRKKTKNKTRE